MEFWRSLAGMVRITLTSADTAACLTAMDRAGIPAREVTALDELNLSILLRRQDLKKLRRLCDKKGASLTVTGRAGIYWPLKGLLGRPVLVVGLAILLAAALYLPSRVLFVRVEGNLSVPTKKILEQSARCGIFFGTSRREVRSEKVKNALLEAMPELQWVGVNTLGCVATISVREREQVRPDTQTRGVSSIVAARDGIIAQCTVQEGTLKVQPGQAVRAGEVLISGYTDCTLSIRAGAAKGEVYAWTERQITAISPMEYALRGAQREISRSYALKIGKKRINFYKGSGISSDTCVKMYSENYVTLPGGFVLPVALVTETYIGYETQQEAVKNGEQLLSDFSGDYLKQQMTAGQILEKQEHLESGDGWVRLSGRYQCLEMIGIQRNEEIVKPYGNND